MFGLRRRHRKQSAAPAVPSDASSTTPVSLSEEQLFDAIKAKLDDFMGVGGTWALVRRDPEKPSDDTIFASMSTFSLARDITAMLISGPQRDSVPQPDTRMATSSDGSAERALRPVPAADRDRDQVAIELTAIAKWADPQHHDPDFVDPAIVSPVSTAAERSVHTA